MPAKDDVLSFCLFLLGEQQKGFIELRYAPGDPADGLKSAGFYEWPREAAIIVEDAVELAERHGDAYISSNLFSCAERKKEYALPSRIIGIDDAPERDDYSAVVRTSAAKRQGYFLLDQPVAPDIREALSERAKEALHGDHCHDCTRIVRLPIGLNTKCGGAYPVHLDAMTDRVYTVAELEAMFPQCGPGKKPQESAPSGQFSLDLLPDVIPLLKDGIPRRFKPHTQGYRVLTGEITPRNSQGVPDTSTRRAYLALALIYHGYPDDEAMALLLHLGEEGSERKGRKWLEQDCARLIAKYRERHPEIVTHATRAQSPTEARYPRSSEPPERGKCPDERRAEIRRMLADWRMDDLEGRAFYDVADMADRFGVCVRTIQSDLAALEDAGEIVRHQLPGPGGRPWIEIVECAEGSSQIHAVPAPQNAAEPCDAMLGETHRAVARTESGAIPIPAGRETVEKIHCADSPQFADVRFAEIRKQLQGAARAPT